MMTNDVGRAYPIFKLLYITQSDIVHCQIQKLMESNKLQMRGKHLLILYTKLKAEWIC